MAADYDTTAADYADQDKAEHTANYYQAIDDDFIDIYGNTD